MTTLEDWFEVRECPDRIIAIGEPGHDENVKSYLIVGDDLALLFDTGMGIGNIRRTADQFVKTPILVVNSHAHWDHVGDDHRFDRIWIHEAEANDLQAGVSNERTRRFLIPDRFTVSPPDWIDPETFSIPGVQPERTLTGGERIDLGGRELIVVHTPGHSPGGITLVEESTGIAFTADAVYAGALYAHLSGSDPVSYRTTLSQLANLAPSLRTIYPSHNDYPLEPSFLIEAHTGYESIWDGRAPDGIDDGVERHEFQGFSVLVREGWRERNG